PQPGARHPRLRPPEQGARRPRPRARGLRLLLRRRVQVLRPRGEVAAGGDQPRAGRALRDPRRARQLRPPRRGARALEPRPDPVRPGARPGAPRHEAALPPDDRADPRPDPAVHADRAEAGEPRRRRREAPRRDRDRARGRPDQPQPALQHPRLRPARRPAELPLLPRLAQPRHQRRLQPPGRERAAGPGDRAPVLHHGQPGGDPRLRVQPDVPEDAPAAHERADERDHRRQRRLRLMQTHPPALSRILIAVGFALSCFGLALFLWISFGGPLPLKAKGYEFTVPFDEATRLAVQSDVRISGVNVGKVEQVKLGSDGLAHALIELDDRYAPIPSDTRVILRQKTLLGETYVELTPGSRSAPPVPEGGSLPRAQVSSAVQLDEILRAF